MSDLIFNIPEHIEIVHIVHYKLIMLLMLWALILALTWRLLQ